MAKAPIKRPIKAPMNQSRAAGARAPTSAAATKPMEGAHHGDGGGFYSPDDGGVEEAPPLVAGYEQRFTGAVRSGSLPTERGGTVDREVLEHMAADASQNPAELAAEIERIRAFRKPIGAYAQKLALPSRAGYHRHWFNDTAGRVEEAKNNGWAHVKDNDNKPICRCVGTGRDKGALYAYAMEIPEVFWLEDMAAKNKAATDKMDALAASPFQSKPGQAQAADKGKFYDPTDAGVGPLQIVKG